MAAEETELHPEHSSHLPSKHWLGLPGNVRCLLVFWFCVSLLPFLLIFTFHVSLHTCFMHAFLPYSWTYASMYPSLTHLLELYTVISFCTFIFVLLAHCAHDIFVFMSYPVCFVRFTQAFGDTGPAIDIDTTKQMVFGVHILL